MKKLHLILTEILIGIIILAFTSCAPSRYFSNAEYDDMYYNSNDRNQPVLVASTTTDIYNYRDDDQKSENWSAKNVNPEYTARYIMEQHQDTVVEEEVEEPKVTIINRYYSTPYYPNYNSWNTGFSYMGRIYDPFYDPFWLESQYFYPNYFMHYSPSTIYMTLRLNRFPRAYAQYYAYNYHRYWNPYDSFYGYGHYGYGSYYGHYGHYNNYASHYGYGGNNYKNPQYNARTKQRTTPTKRIIADRTNRIISNSPRNNANISKRSTNRITDTNSRLNYSRSQNELNNRNNSVQKLRQNQQITRSRTKSTMNYQKPQKSSVFRGNSNVRSNNYNRSNSQSKTYIPRSNSGSRSFSTPSYSGGSRSSGNSGSRNSGSNSGSRSSGSSRGSRQ